MAITPTYPGVYVQETPSTNHIINGVPTANTAFVDAFERGPLNKPVMVTNFGEFTSTFGKQFPQSKSSYGIQQFFENGGATAFVVRVAKAGATPAAKVTTATSPPIPVSAVGPGTWGNYLQVATQVSQNANAEPGTFDLVVRELSVPSAAQPKQVVIASEVHMSLSTDPDASNFVTTVLAHQSQLIEVTPDEPVAPFNGPPATTPDPSTSITNGTNISTVTDTTYAPLTGGVDDNYPIEGGDLGIQGTATTTPTGYYTLTEIAPSIFNLLCMPMMSTLSADEWLEVFTPAFGFCEAHKAFFILDYPTAEAEDTATAASVTSSIQPWWFQYVSNKSNHAAAFFPRLKIPNPNSSQGLPMNTETSGTMAGIFARTDASRGVWKAPAGEEAVLQNVIEPTAKLNDQLNGELNPLGINCIRTFPVIGTVSWGSRTGDGANLLDSQWKYIPVRRTALFIEESLQQGTIWAVFEPNDEALWSALRLAAGGFMDSLFKQGAFPAKTQKDAYFVKCDATTTTPRDVANGVVNLVVGFAPLIPAEFVVITITQIVQTS